MEARVDAHAKQALNLVAVLAPRMPFDEALAMTRDGRITDAMSVVAIPVITCSCAAIVVVITLPRYGPASTPNNR